MREFKQCRPFRSKWFTELKSIQWKEMILICFIILISMWIFGWWRNVKNRSEFIITWVVLGCLQFSSHLWADGGWPISLENIFLGLVHGMVGSIPQVALHFAGHNDRMRCRYNIFLLPTLIIFPQSLLFLICIGHIYLFPWHIGVQFPFFQLLLQFWMWIKKWFLDISALRMFWT